MGKEGVTLHEARLHRQDLQIQKLMEDMDNLNQNYMRYRNLLMEFQSNRDSLIQETVEKVIDYINYRGIEAESVTTNRVRLKDWEENE